MIITRTPVRISLGGGGTDLPSYYSKYGGFLVSGAIDKYVYITLNKRFEDSNRITYSQMEIVEKVREIKHPIVREALTLLDVNHGVEIHSVANVPANTGLGSSSSFTVGLLNALHTYKRDYIPLKELAEEACKIEMEILGEPIGKQDQYISTFGGIQCLEIDKNGKVTITPLQLYPDTIDELERNIMLFYTGIQRNASEILREQKETVSKEDSMVVEAMYEIKEIGREAKMQLEKGNLSRFGALLDAHWRVKKRLSSKISDSNIDKWYDLAIKNGVSGGKIMGAGGGGFFMFYCENKRDALRKALEEEGLREMHFRFDFEGTKTIGQF